MPENPATPSPVNPQSGPAPVQALEPCPIHSQPAKWRCAHCGKPMCPLCKPVGFNYLVYHNACLEQARRKPEKPRIPSAADGPSTGVKVIAWSYVAGGILLFGLGLLATGVVLFSRHHVPFSALMTQAPSSVDDLPGGRTLLGWGSALALVGSVLAAWLGIGLLNLAQTARRIVLFFSWLELVVSGIAWIVIAVLGQGFWDIPVVSLVLIIFFSRKTVKQQFERVA